MNELKVGLLALAALASVVYMSFRITANQSGFGKYVKYKTVLDDATGIFEKSAIRVAGINAGKIKSIELYNNKALVIFELLEQVKLTENSKLVVKSVGLLGDRFLDIELGNQSLPRLPEESVIPSGRNPGFADLSNEASNLIKEVKDVVVSIKQAIRTDKSENVIYDILDNIREVSLAMKRISTDNEDKINGILDDVKKITSQLAYETDRNKDGSFMNDLGTVGPILEKVDKIAGDLRIIVADVKDGRGTVGKLLRDEYVVDQVEQTLSSVNRLINRINQIEADIALFTGMNSNNGNDTRFDMDLFPAPERFFRLGLVTNQFGPQVKDERLVQTDQPGVGPEYSRTEVKKNALKFNVQIGRRVQRLGIRAGMIESTGGLGIDYHFPDFGVRTTLEAFDYRKKIGPNVRVMTELRMWNVFYGRVAVEDLASKINNRSYTISAGLRFTDQDLAALVGLLSRW